MKILILGATGMLGNAIFRFLSSDSNFQTIGAIRLEVSKKKLPEYLWPSLISGIDIDNIDSISYLFSLVKPDIVINCIGLVKQLQAANEPLSAIPMNSLLPHRLALLSEIASARLIHISTDCVFSGLKGMYSETDIADARDLYGISKYLGEVDYPHAITLRTSIIGHELDGARSLVGWFLSQTGSVNGFKRAIFSGLPTVEIARVIRDHVIPHPELHGVYHVSADPINKFDLLTLLAQTYDKSIVINPDDQLVIDRSLDSSRFQHATGFSPKPWPELLSSMREFS